ncbi:RF-1 domain-containing protein [Ditylenchus destructor]|nr:RF-1 domain-containing protein [Ditylenchus destructor]
MRSASLINSACRRFLFREFGFHSQCLRYASSQKMPDLSIPVSEIRFEGDIPTDRIRRSFVLASGPGGQFVNKTHTKCWIRFNVKEADWIPKRLKEHFEKKYGSQINDAGEWSTYSMISRTQDQNMEHCLNTLRKALDSCTNDLIEEFRLMSEEDKRVLKERAEKADEQRKLYKERLKEKRQNRRKSFDVADIF